MEDFAFILSITGSLLEHRRLLTWHSGTPAPHEMTIAPYHVLTPTWDQSIPEHWGGRSGSGSTGPSGLVYGRGGDAEDDVRSVFSDGDTADDAGDDRSDANRPVRDVRDDARSTVGGGDGGDDSGYNVGDDARSTVDGGDTSASAFACVSAGHC